MKKILLQNCFSKIKKNEKLVKLANHTQNPMILQGDPEKTEPKLFIYFPIKLTLKPNPSPNPNLNHNPKPP